MYETKLREMFAELKKRADAALDKGDKFSAASLYGQCGDILMRIASMYSGELRKKREKVAQTYYELQQNLLGTSTSLTPKPVTVAKEEEDFSAHVDRFIEKTSVHWNDIAGMDDTKREIKETFALSSITNKPKGVQGIHTILLYGPPGTGKTLLASALAGSHNYPFFNIRLSQALSKYYGESEKIISQVFKSAREKAPAIVFFDEFDAVALSRSGELDEATRRVLSTLLTELEGLNGTNKDLMVIAATNAPWDLDPAILSRIERSIYVPLPGVETAKKILELNTTEKEMTVDEDLTSVAERCVQQRYSGREIRNIAREAIRAMIQEQNPDLSSLADKPIDEAKNYTLKTRPLTSKDFLSAFEKIEAKAQPDLIRRYSSWAQDME